jgi:H+/Cl- antiporter ClcA
MMKPTVCIFLASTLVAGVNAFQPSILHSAVKSQALRTNIYAPLVASSKSRLFLEADNALPLPTYGGGTPVGLGQDMEYSGHFRSAAYVLCQAGLLGMLTGWMVGIFKLSIDAVSHLFYHHSLATRTRLPFTVALIPAIGGLLVGILSRIGQFPPGLRGTIELVDEGAKKPQSSVTAGIRHAFRSIQKSTAAVITLGTGCSLGPEGPSVEIGMNLSRLIMDIFPRNDSSISEIVKQNRLLLACGAAAGVSAGFNAPIAGVFFALEIMQSAFMSIDEKNAGPKSDTTQSLTTTSESMSAVLVSSVLSALVSRALVGEHLHLSLAEYSMRTPLLELPLYMMLGATSGGVAFLFSQAANLAQSFFKGEVGPKRFRKRIGNLPAISKPMLGGLFCGLVGLAFPQVLFGGYSLLNELLANNVLPTSFLLGLLSLKMATTAVAAGAGLVGGTFAPSLFLGAMTGGVFHNIAAALFKQPVVQHSRSSVTLAILPALMMADVPAYAMMGAASVLAAVFRAPLTACLLLFELTRDYNVILPVMTSCGVASVVGDILDYRQKERKRRRDQDAVSWGDLSDKRIQKVPFFPKEQDKGEEAPVPVN